MPSRLSPTEACPLLPLPNSAHLKIPASPWPAIFLALCPALYPESTLDHFLDPTPIPTRCRAQSRSPIQHCRPDHCPCLIR